MLHFPNGREGNQGSPALRYLNFQISQTQGFKGDFHQWEHLLRIHERDDKTCIRSLDASSRRD